MGLVSTVLAILTTASTPVDEVARVLPIAEAIARAAEERPVFEGSYGVERTALALAVIAKHESGLRESVRTCRVRGDNGLAWGLFQVRRHWLGAHSTGELCTNDNLQARITVRVLHAYRDRGVRGSALLLGYASGDPGRPTKAGLELVRDFKAMERKLDEP